MEIDSWGMLCNNDPWNQDGGGSETGSGRDQAVVPVPKFDR